MGGKTIVPVLILIAGVTGGFAPAARGGDAGAVAAGLRAEEIAFADIPQVFTAAKKLQSLREAPATVDVVTAREIRQWGSRNLQDLLRRIPGIVVRNYGIVYEVYIRGVIGKDRVLCLVDGRRINSAFDGSFRGDLPLNNVERIEIIRGPGSALYGPNAFGGVINIITRQGSDVDGVSMTARAGSESTSAFGIQAGASTGGFDGLATVGHLESQGQRILNDNDAYEENDLFVKFSYRGLTFSGGRYAFNQGIQGRIGRESPIDNLDDTADYADLAYVHHGESVGLNLRGFNEKRTNVYVLGGRPLTYEGTLQGGEAQASWTINRRNFIIAGLDLRRDEAGQDGRLFDVSNTGIYLEYEVKPVDPVLITLGGRYDIHSQYEDVVSPRASAVWLPNQPTSLRFSYGEAFRAPSIQDLYVDFYLSPTIHMVGNEDLQPEKLKTIELAVLRRFGDWLDTSLNAFSTRAEDLIQVQSAFAGGMTVNSAQNVGAAKIMGVEAGARGNPVDWFGFFLNVTYQEAEDGDGNRLLYLPRQTLNAGVTLTPWKPVAFSVLARYAGKRPGVDNDRRLPVDLDPYTVVDLTARGTWRGLSAEAGVYNILDEGYQETHGYPMPRRSFLVTVGYTF